MKIDPMNLITLPETMRRLSQRNRRQQAKYINKLTAQHAVSAVYTTDNKMLEFVQKHFATKRHSTHFELLAAMRGHSVVAKDSPFNKEPR